MTNNKRKSRERERGKKKWIERIFFHAPAEKSFVDESFTSLKRVARRVRFRESLR